MERQEALKGLFRIKSFYHLDISEQLDKLGSAEDVPEDVENFINKYDYKIEHFLENLKEKEFYKSLKNPKTDFVALKGLSSLITHALIEVEKKPEQKPLIVEKLKVVEVTKALQTYLLTDNKDETFQLIKEIKETINNIEEVGENK